MEGRGSTAEPGRAELTYGDYEEGTRRMRQEEVFGKLSNWRCVEWRVRRAQVQGCASTRQPLFKRYQIRNHFLFMTEASPGRVVHQHTYSQDIQGRDCRELYSNTYVPTYSDDVTAEIEIPTL
ncbi:hypothetical protein FOXB_07264 [Fusarium oxysporum f. sp. conglutinans Fo5176]|uniref:Uncharacterized protein n=1 Tax=Fusarium oxysporum (strain Fo5176) TaxID=660025 RepID=F9FLI4_FUSOF|nr:hypothetical protein FOXB_07264 [Fusarium oxysporum f. sp. conglutinans Fo5176]